jgi:hypothetical protein
MDDSLVQGSRPSALALALLATCLLLLFAAGCGGDDYWDGGDFGGQPASNLAGDVTKEAHDELAACGFSDDDATQLNSSSGGETASFNASGESAGSIKVTVLPTGNKVAESVDASGERKGALNVTQIAPGVVEYDCQN